MNETEPSTIEVLTADVAIIVFSAVAAWALWHLVEALAR